MKVKKIKFVKEKIFLDGFLPGRDKIENKRCCRAVWNFTGEIMSKRSASENKRTRSSVKSLEEINAILKEHKEELKKRYRIKEIGVFGSYVRGDQKKRGSDIDILVEFEEGEIPDLFKFIEMERYLSSLLSKKVDLVRKKVIRPELKDIVLKEVVYI